MTTRSAEADARPRAMGGGGSERCFAITASRVGAWKGGAPENIS